MKRISKRNYILSVAIFIYPFFPIIKEWNSTIGLFLELIVLVGLCIKTLIRRNKNQIIFSVKKPFVSFIVFLLFYLLLNIVNIYSAFSGFRAILLYLIVYSELIKDDCTKKENIKISIMTNVVVTVVMSIGCIVQFIMPDIIKNLHNPQAWNALRMKTDWKPLGIYNRALSLMTDPNVLGVFLAFSFFMIYLLYWYTRKKRYLLLSGLVLVAIILTQSRTAVFLIIIYFIVSIVKSILKKGGVKVSKIIVAILAIVAIAWILFAYWEEILSYLRIDTFLNGNGRTDKNIEHMEKLLNKPWLLLFGNGLFDGRTIIFENCYLLLIYMFGCMGTVVFGMLVRTYFGKIINMNNIEVIVCYLAACFVGDYILIPQITLVVLMVLAMNMRPTDKKIKDNRVTK